MERLAVGDAELEVESVGDGEPILFIHGSISGRTWVALMAEPALRSRYRMTHYHRRGFHGSSRVPAGFGIPQQAADALAVARSLGAGPVHVVGHSYGAAISLQLALDAPEAVASLALLEPPIFASAAGEEFAEQAGPIVATYEAGGKSQAVVDFLDLALEPGWRPLCEPHLPAGWLDEAVADIDTFFQVEFPMLAEWSFGPEEGARITQPCLAVLGGNSGPFFIEGNDALREWIPQTEKFVLPGATHGLQYMNPKGMAEGLAAFLARHPIGAVPAG